MPETKQGTQVTMPKLGESVTEGTIAGWLKQVGDRVEKYDPLVEVVTDKVNAEVPAPVTGTITEILTEDGDIVPVGGAICIIDAEGAAIEEGTPSDEAEDAIQETTEVATTEDVDEEDEEPDRTVVMSAARIDKMKPVATMLTDRGQRQRQQPQTNGQRIDSQQALQQARVERDELTMLRIRSSPLVRRLSEEHDVDLTNVEGTGIGGRVTKSDIERYIAEGPEEPVRAKHPAPPPPPERHAPPPKPHAAPEPPPPPSHVELQPGDEVIEATPMRRQIADHMARSKQTAPHVSVWMEVDMSKVVSFRDAHKQAFSEREGQSLTYVPLVASAVVGALQEHRRVNASWNDGQIILRKAIHLGIAIALEENLVVPVVKHAEERNLLGLARSINDLVSRARNDQLKPDDVGGGTFTLNNPGALGSISSTPIIVQPQSAILSMEAIVKRPVVIDDAIAIRPIMNLSLSVDHRLLDGLTATRFLADVKQRLESFEGDGSL